MSKNRLMLASTLMLSMILVGLTSSAIVINPVRATSYVSEFYVGTGSAGQDAGVGTQVWIDPDNIEGYLNDGNYAYSTGREAGGYLAGYDAGLNAFPTTSISYWIFGFFVTWPIIPDDATINGIEVRIYQKGTNNIYAKVYDYGLIIQCGYKTSQNRAHTSVAWSSTWGWNSHGGSTDTWGMSLTGDDLYLGGWVNLQVCFSATRGAPTAYVDAISILVYWTEWTP